MKLKTYVITLSKHFPAYHIRKGEDTDFEKKLLIDKLHTIRGNYKYWKPKIDEINHGRAVLSIRQWIDKPYKKPGQRELMQLTKVGIQHISLYNNMDEDDLDLSIFVGNCKDSEMPFYFSTIDEDTPVTYGHGDLNKLIANDGLTYEDFKSWFKDDLVDGCILHFTDLRY